MKKIKHWVLMAGIFWHINVLAESIADARLNEKMGEHADIVVYRSPTCGCCGRWVKYLQRNQFRVRDVITEGINDIKQKYAVSGQLASCHTALIGGYVVEGHVPVADIKSMLANKPDIVGVSVPGMVTGTPGMEMGNTKDPFKVLAFDHNGQTKIFNSYDNY